jgi:hypothetical protein
MKIGVTDEMIELAQSAFEESDARGLPRAASWKMALTAAFSLVERDYEITQTEPPADVNEIRDVEGDRWYRLADGRWICPASTPALFANTAREIADEHGPLSWLVNS